MSIHDRTYLQMMLDVIADGEHVENRTGTDSVSVLGYQAKYDLEDGFPLLTTKKVNWKFPIAEMLWFISGKCDDIQGLVQTDRDGNEIDGRFIWDKWADENGKLGPVYGVNWRHWISMERDTVAHVGVFVDQLQTSIDMLKTSPGSRRNIVTSWQPADVPDQALPPCHVLFKFTARNGKLHTHMWQRSLDIPIGGPFNICQYAALTMMVAKLCGLEPGVFTHSIDDAHIYVNQTDGCQTQLARDPWKHKAPKLIIHGDQQTIDDFRLEDFELVGYNHEPFIKFPVAV